jgi:hypothetical protein
MQFEFNYDHLAPLEVAARIYCQMQDQDADEKMEVPHPLGLAGVKLTRPAWHFAAEALLQLNQMLVALKRAAEAQADALHDAVMADMNPH